MTDTPLTVTDVRAIEKAAITLANLASRVRQGASATLDDAEEFEWNADQLGQILARHNIVSS